MAASGERGTDVSADADPPRHSRDEDPVGWGDEPTSGDDEDVARLIADRPPHHDRF
jgi:hypothetical protein